MALNNQGNGLKPGGVRCILDLSTAACASLLVSFFTLLVAPAGLSAQNFDTANRTVTIKGTTYPYRVFQPKKHQHARRKAVILYLHGAGERGNDGILPVSTGLAPAISRIASQFPFVAVFPQCPTDSAWQGEPAEAAMAALRETMTQYNIDPRRVYVAGNSMGGFGTWEFALKYPGTFAAIVSVCGGIVPPPKDNRLRAPTVQLEGPDPYLAVARKLRGMPAWLFHGALDRVVPVTESRSLVRAFREVGTPVRYTEFDSTGHNAWNRAFSDQRLWRWLGGQQLARHKK